MEVLGQRSLHISSIYPVDRKASVLMTLHQDDRMIQDIKWHRLHPDNVSRLVWVGILGYDGEDKPNKSSAFSKIKTLDQCIT